MRVVYFTVPVLSGYYLLGVVQERSNAKWGIKDQIPVGSSTYKLPKELEERRDETERFRDSSRLAVEHLLKEQEGYMKKRKEYKERRNKD